MSTRNPDDKRSIDERIDDILAAIELNHADHDARIARLEAVSTQIAETQATLARVQEQMTPILIDHEVRLKRLEGQQ